MEQHHTHKNPYHSDHDLLIRIDTKLGLLIEQFHTHKDHSLKELAILQESKMDKEEALRIKKTSDEEKRDHEQRLRRLERYGSIAIGGLFVVQAILGIKII